MATIATQRDLVVTLKKETVLNVNILSKVRAMSPELSRLILKDNALEKPTQNLFNQLSYYLLTIIDANIAATMTWPIYDTKGERAYRSEMAKFISDYSSKGLLNPVMSSYLVNPGSFKVILLMFQLSQLAVKRVLEAKMQKDDQKNLYNEITEKYKSQEEGFTQAVENATQKIHNKFSNYLLKRKIYEQIAEQIRTKITQYQTSILKAQNYIDNIVDGFLKTHNVDEDTKSEIVKIKNVKERPQIFDAWLEYVDDTMNDLEKRWNEKASPLLTSSQSLRECSEALIAKHTGNCDLSMYRVEYNHKNDEICTKELQNIVNSEQKYVLRNLQKDGVLNFPNLIRAFVVSVCFILKHNEIGDEIYNFNAYLDSGRQNYAELITAMRILIDRVLNAEAKLQPTTIPYNSTLSIKELAQIPPLPNISNLKASRDCNQVLFDTFTPLNINKHQFNLLRKSNITKFAKPYKPLITPFHTAPRDDFLKSIISCRISTYDRQPSQENHDMSLISHGNRVNETIAECSSGFTKQQILRLLSTKKTSSSKKKHNMPRPNINVKKGGLFNETTASNEGNPLFRSYSSPNLFENKKRYQLSRGRQLSVMEEDNPSSILELSGIAALDRDINISSPQDFAESSRTMDTSSMPAISVPSNAENRIHSILNADINLDKELDMTSLVSPIEAPRKGLEIENLEARCETPQTNNQSLKKISSLEKIINRFKKVRASVLPDKKEDSVEFKTIVEEKENIRTDNVDVFTANRILLPDLLSPSCSSIPNNSNDNTNFLDQICDVLDKVESRKPRQSLGTALGVDQTFLDQFDLID